MITQRIQTVGNFAGQLVDNAADSVAQFIELGSHIIITANRLDNVDAFSDANIIAASIYTAVVTNKPNPYTFQGYDLSWYLGTPSGLGDLIDVAISGTTQTLSQWWTLLKPASVNTGTITNTGTNYTGSFLGMSRREAWTTVCQQCGAEWRLNPNNSMDAAAIATLYPTSTTPTVVVTKREEGQDGDYRGLQGTVLESGEDIEEYNTNVTVWASGSGTSIVTAAANSGATTYKDFNGNNLVMERFVNAPTDTSTTAATLATAELGKASSKRRQLSVRSATYAVTRFAKPGDYVYAFDQSAQLTDSANQITYRGELLPVIKLRVFGLTWPIERGMGVYCRKWVAGVATYKDLSDQWEYETGEVAWEVGQVPMILASPTAPNTNLGTPSSTGAAYLGANPAIVGRVAATIGVLGVHSLTTNFVTVAVHTTLQDEGLTKTVDDVAGRRYKFTLAVNPYCVGGVQTILYRLLRDGVPIRDWNIPGAALDAGFSYGMTLTFAQIIATTHAASVYKIQMAASLANTAVNSFADAGTYPRQLIIEDIGNL